jgi:hypothetical protein
MSLKTPEQELEEFLVGGPKCLRRIIQPGPLSDEEWSSFYWWGLVTSWKARDKFETLLQRCPTMWRDYRSRCRELALRSVPKGRPGRPREDSLAREAARLKQQGLGPTEIARRLNREHPNRKDRAGHYHPLTAGAVRKMLSPRKENKTAEKT